jgi:electron transfer flavoprotein alpha subunit
MKAVAVIEDIREMGAHARDMIPLLSSVADRLTSLELWVFYTGTPPEAFPCWPVPLTAVHRMAVAHDPVPDQLLDLLMRKAAAADADLYLFAGTDTGNCLAARLGFRLKAGTCLGVESCHMTGETTLATVRPVFGSRIQARFVLDTPPWCLSAAQTPGRNPAMAEPVCPVSDHPQPAPCRPPWLTSTRVIPIETDDRLPGADRILVLGNGVGSQDTLERLKPVARALGAQMGASRPVVMNGWLPLDRLVGISGSVTAPSVCIVAGVSGTGVFCAGIRHAGFVVAVNTDPDAPVFRAADVGIVDDLVPVLLELGRLIRGDEPA